MLLGGGNWIYFNEEKIAVKSIHILESFPNLIAQFIIGQ